jgi:hypothetical protein
MWSTQDGAKWTTTANVDFVSQLGVTAIVVVGNFIFCGYEAPFPHNPTGGGAAAAAGAAGATGTGTAAQGFSTAHGAAAAASAASAASSSDTAHQGSGLVAVGMIRVLNLLGGDQGVEVSFSTEIKIIIECMVHKSKRCSSSANHDGQQQFQL